MRNTVKQFLITAAAALVLFACSERPSNFATDVAVPVSVEEIRPKSIKQIYQTTGVVTASREISKKSEMTGYYQLQRNPRSGNLYKMGDHVKNGEVIIRLVDREYENNINIEGAKLDFEISDMEYQKQIALYEKGGVTMRELVNSERSLLTAKKNYENAQISIDKMAVKTPFDGIITALPYFSQGLRVESGTDLVSMMDFRQLVLDLSFPENMLGSIKISQTVDLMNYTAANDTLTGIISELSPAIDRTARTFAGRITINNPKEIIHPGMFVRCEIELERKDSTIVIPKEMLITDGRNKIVFVAERETAQLRVVRTGLENKGEVEILEGLQAGERLIVKGYETLTNRSRIKILN
jgi:membrane fusion protein, multidrug efflux system